MAQTRTGPATVNIGGHDIDAASYKVVEELRDRDPFRSQRALRALCVGDDLTQALRAADTYAAQMETYLDRRRNGDSHSDACTYMDSQHWHDWITQTTDNRDAITRTGTVTKHHRCRTCGETSTTTSNGRRRSGT